MSLPEYFNYRDELLEQSKDDEGFIQESLLLSEVLPLMLDAKLIDSEDFNNSYFKSSVDKMKINAYSVNETGERLSLFIVNESSIDLSEGADSFQISTKSHYEDQFKRGVRFLNKAIKGHLNDEIQDADPARALISQVSSSAGVDQFDVVELFLITMTATVSLQGSQPYPKKIEFDNEEIVVSYQKSREKKSKGLLIKKKLIDLNFLYSVLLSQGNREPLKIDFEEMFGLPLHAIKAADEEKFESYLCVLPASIISGLYREYSSRLLEKNVRSFLQLRNSTNSGIRETIRKAPEKFVAYNNGLTITATNSQIISENGISKIKSLTDFQIVNGGQTTATIYFTHKDGFDISQVKVMAKINVAKESTEEELEDLIANISTYSNAQSRVSKVDLRSRNPQLVKLKSLSESVITPSGGKWLFERAKGEFSTKLRIAGKNKSRLQKDYPSEKRFSKEQLAKYFCSWGDQPHVVKKGGEKVFRHFIEELCGEGKSKKAPEISRSFYEELIAKIIIFRKMEKLYGQGKKAIGQIRSAVVPYSISILYNFTDRDNKSNSFDLLKVWLNEGNDDELNAFFSELLQLTNDLIKKYSKSDDLGEYSKKQELWETIIKSSEVKEFTESQSFRKIIDKYKLTREELKRRLKKAGKLLEVDFKNTIDSVTIISNGGDYYDKICELLSDDLTPPHRGKLSLIISSISNHLDLDDTLIEFEKKLINSIRINHPSIFDQLPSCDDFLMFNTLEFIIKKYNSAIENNESITSLFNGIEELASVKNAKYASVFRTIGKQLESGDPPSIQQVFYASYYLMTPSTDDNNSRSRIHGDIPMSALVIRRMVEWDTTHKVLTPNELNYIADFAFGLKNLNSFHEKNIKRHMKKLMENGFKV